MKEILKQGKWGARLIAWAGVLIFVFANALEKINITSSPIFVVCLCIFLAAFSLTGILDLIRSFEK